MALAEYIIDHGATVRAAAAKFGLSKSTVHKEAGIRVGSQWSLRLPAKRPRSNEKGDGLKPSPCPLYRACPDSEAVKAWWPCASVVPYCGYGRSSLKKKPHCRVSPLTLARALMAHKKEGVRYE